MATSSETCGEEQSFKDRSTALVVLGVALIVLGLMSGGMAALAVLGQFLAAASGAVQPMGSIAMSLLFYGGGAICLIVLGIGSIQARRWARAITLVGMWMTLVIGVLTLLFVPIILSDLSIPIPPGTETPGALQMQIMKAAMIAVVCTMLVFQVLLPIPFILVYGSVHTKATCERRNPAPSWTDACPLPMLAVVLLCLYGAASTAVMAASMPVLPWLDRIVTGLPAVAGLTVITVVMLALALGFYRLRPEAWWAALFLLLVGAGVGGYTVYQMDMVALFEAMGMPPEQIEMIRPMGIFDLYQRPAVMAMMVGTFVLYVGYLLYIHRYFRKPPERTRPLPG